jgi:RNA polymerase sigma factor (sigma-70 family)
MVEARRTAAVNAASAPVGHECSGWLDVRSGFTVSHLQTASAGDLIDGCRRGDERCWAEMVARYEPLVFTIARRNGLAPSDASDVTQFTFSKLLQEIDSLRDVDRLASWLGTVARREAWRVGQKCRSEANQELTPLDGIDDSWTELIVHWQTREAIVSALQELGSPCREVMYWLFLDPEAPSHAQIAERLGRATGGVGPLRMRCLEKLRPLLSDYFHDR